MVAKNRRTARIKRATRTRMHLREIGLPRLCVHRTPRHIYAQVLSSDGGNTVVSASTVDKKIRAEVIYGGNVAAAAVVGRVIGERAVGAGLEKVAFDRSGFKYHGRVATLAQAARKAGLLF